MTAAVDWLWNALVIVGLGSLTAVIAAFGVSVVAIIFASAKSSINKDQE